MVVEKDGPSPRTDAFSPRVSSSLSPQFDLQVWNEAVDTDAIAAEKKVEKGEERPL